jgi:hypothetical protein
MYWDLCVYYYISHSYIQVFMYFFVIENIFIIWNMTKCWEVTVLDKIDLSVYGVTEQLQEKVCV